MENNLLRQNIIVSSGKLENEKKYWLDKLNGDITMGAFPADMRKERQEQAARQAFSSRVPDELLNRLNRMSGSSMHGMYLILLTCTAYLLSRYTDNEDIVLGMPPSDEGGQEGYSNGLLPLRVKVETGLTFKDLLLQVRSSVIEAEKNCNFPIGKLTGLLNLPVDEDGQPQFNTAVLMNGIHGRMSARALKAGIVFAFGMEDGCLTLDIEYSSGLYYKETAEQILRHLVNILRAVLDNPGIMLNEVEMLSEEEKTKILCGFNATKAGYPENKTIHRLFEEQVEKTPDNIAVTFENKVLTYRQLNEKANRLAMLLRKRGVSADSIVAIMMERSLDMAVSLMAILKAGGAYLPVDVHLPMERISFMLEESGVKIVLTDRTSMKDIPFTSMQEVITVDELWECIGKEDAGNLDPAGGSDSLAYVMYTSGSTGNPKGVMVEHRQVNNCISWMQNEFKLGQKDVIVQRTNLTFDPSVWELFWPLYTGAGVKLITYEQARDAEFLIKLMNEDTTVTMMYCPASLITGMTYLLNSKPVKTRLKLPWLIIGAESISMDTVKSFYNYFEGRIVNTYGPTECTINNTFYYLERDDKHTIVPIGKPVANNKVYILSNELQLMPLKAAGEIYIEGDSLARGYINNPGKTSENFIRNPFSEGRLYKTGDTGRWLEDGNIEIMGRVDEQVKIRGFRIELGEIESRLLGHPRIKETVVLAKEDPQGSSYLAAYFVGEDRLTASQLREHLAKDLPDYMIPAYFVQIEKIPLSPNGKIDRKALPDCAGISDLDEEFTAPLDAVEERLVEIWKDVLGRDGIGTNHNFFHIGGHSLKAAILISRIHMAFNTAVPLSEVFRTPTIKDIAGYIRTADKSMYSSIPRVEVREYYPVSPAQKRMYMLNRIEGSSTSYNMPGTAALEGKLDKARFEEAFRELIKRHEAFRTSFEMVEGELVQRIHGDVAFEVMYKEADEEQAAGIRADFIKPFDLSLAPLLRVGLIKVTDDRHILVCDMHHIISDGISMDILEREFMELYNGKKLPELRLQYKDYSEWQNDLLKSETMKKQEEYWLDVFKGEIPVLDMPADYPRPPFQSFEGDRIHFETDSGLTGAINRLTVETGTTVYMLLLSAYNILLSKYTGNEDIIVGSPIAGRPHADLENIIGMFINTLAMRNYPAGEKTFADFLLEVKENSLRAYENQSYQFEELVDKLDLKRDLSRNPVFDTMFVLQNTGRVDVDTEGLVLKQFKYENKTSKFDLTLNAVENVDGITFDLEYCTKLFKKETMERLAGHFINILQEVIKNPLVKLSEIQMLSEEERSQLLVSFNETYAEYPKDKTIHLLFEEQVERTPENTAVVFENKQLTYRELNEKANRLARVLRAHGVGPDYIVAIALDRSLEMIIGILAVLKAGGAYLPIDPEYPRERIAYMLEDSGAGMLLTQEKKMQGVNFQGTIIDIGEERLEISGTENLDNLNAANHLAYIIYTSGTTGKPKGTMIEHENVVRLMFNDKMQFDFNDKDVWTLFHSYCFDFSVWEMYGALLYGGKLIVVPKLKAQNTREFLKLLEEEKVTVLNQTPTAFYSLIQEEQENSKIELGIRYVIFGGEALQPVMLKCWRKRYPETKLVNMYGITETTVHVTYKEITENEIERNISNIGKPIPTLTVYILDQNMRLLPIGAAGELYVGGKGVGRGYLNNSVLTAQKFIQNPYNPTERLYKSGDLARFLPDGDMEYLGRIDHQVKIRGFRIELGEIESRLLGHPRIKETVVLAKEDPQGSSYLAAYFVGEDRLTASQLREHVAKDLPDYMIPAYFVQIEKMPLSPNGKIDRKALPDCAGISDLDEEYTAPLDAIEEKLAEIWKDVLGRDGIGTNHNFFHIGGHSLKAANLISRIHMAFNTAVPLSEVFRTPTIKDIAGYIRTADKSMYSSIPRVEVREYYPVSPAQKRMYMLNRIEDSSTSYNMPGTAALEGKLDKVRFEEVFRELIKRHEAFRTSFEMVEGELVQRIHGEVEFEVMYKEADEEQAAGIIADFIKPFDLSLAPFLRVALIKVTDDRHILVCDMHHIISDGTSMDILEREFMELYNGKKLPELRLQYKDYSEWQNDLLKSETMKKQEEYWLDVFKGEIPVLDMPVDYPRPPFQSFEGDRIHFETDSGLTGALNRLTVETGTTVYMLLLSAYNILLSKYTGNEDIIVGSPIAGRPHADLENIIGMFINTLAMRNYPAGEKTFADFLLEVKENSLRAYENQSYQFEELVDKLDLKRDLSRNPVFDTMFILQNTGRVDVDTEGLVLNPFKYENKTSKFDLTLNGVENRDGITFELEYCTKLFKKETMERLAGHFINILQEVSKNPLVKLSEIQMLSEEERSQLLVSFNDTDAEYPKDKTIHELFEEQAERTPDSIALVFEDKQLTYRKLNERSNQLARVLRNKGVGPDTIVGIMVERSLEMIIGIMGILKAGGAYMPIDPQYPQDRIRYMLEDSSTRILLIKGNRQEKVTFDGEIVDLEDEELYVCESSELTAVNIPEDLAYLIYTSGSTGNPKGVMIRHISVNNLVKGIADKIEFLPDKTMLCITTISFDIFVLETLVSLARGLKVIIADESCQSDPKLMAKLIKENNIDMIQMTPSRMSMFLKGNYEESPFDNLKEIMIGGEAFSESLLKQVRKVTSARIYNMYGPTETTVWSAINELTNAYKVTIGKPIANTHMYILDKDNQPVPIGAAGEIYISGDGLARGYLNRHELNSERFVDNIFEPGERMYRTGDLARWLLDGNIEFLGRIDYQVKVRGFRIELEEIEARLLMHEAVREAVVAVRDSSEGEGYICAYITLQKDVPIKELRDFLSKFLMEYMIPSCFVKLERMPMSPNGKIDRKALPDCAGISDFDDEYTAPLDAVEEKLAEIWKDILGRDGIGTNHNFFHIGGHSLKAANLISRIHRAFNTAVPLSEVFRTPTIKDIAGYIRTADKSMYSSIRRVEDREYYPVSPAQKRMYMLNRIEGSSTSYNMPGTAVLEGNLDKARFEEAFRELIKRHEAFRTSFYMTEGKPVQRIHSDVEFEVMYKEADEEQAAGIIAGFIKPFDLSLAPLLRVGLIKVTDNSHILAYDMHHIISDGTSMSIFEREFMELYNGKKLPELRLQYKDYSEWQNELLKSEAMKKQEEYWLDVFEGEIPVLDMPLDYPRPSYQSFEGDRIHFETDSELTGAINRLTVETGTTVYMLLLSAYNILLSKYTGNEDIIVGSPIAGRPHADLANIIGIFVNTLAMRNYPAGEKTFVDFLLEVKENSLRAYENQSYQFEELVDKLDLKRDLSRNPVFDTMFILHNIGRVDADAEGLVFNQFKYENKTAKFDLTLNAAENGYGITFDLEYCTKLFKKETMERLAGHFVNILQEVSKNPLVKLSEIQMLSEEEKSQLLISFNDTYAEYPKDKTIHELFEEQAERTPDSIALVFEDKQLTYRQLNERSNQLARVLRNKGVGSDTIVGIMLERSLEMIIGIMGILKAGGAYLPVNPGYPPERIKYMIEDSETKLLLSKTEFINKVQFNGNFIDMKSVDYSCMNTSKLDKINSSRDLLYVIYTSGTTGKPKGVRLEHKNLVNLVYFEYYNTNINFSSNVMQFANMSFDVCYQEIFSTLLCGGRLHIINEENKKQLSELFSFIKRNSIEVIFLPTVFLKVISGENDYITNISTTVKHIITAGEQLIITDNFREFLNSREIYLHNHYGPSETHVVTTFTMFGEDMPLIPPIGKPISNNRIYILDKNMKFKAVGTYGELYIAGDNVGRGYLNNPELTKEKFIPDPFVSGKMMYRTGDLARWLPNGNIEFLGRIDCQVKVRGYRIELGEIEECLLKHPEVNETVVIAREDKNGGKYICSYIVSNHDLSVTVLRDYLSKTLPDYMIPSCFIILDSLPLTPNGKIDRKSLPEPDVNMSKRADYTAPSSIHEVKLAQIWEEVLEIERVGIHDDFFELGGDSIKGMSVISLAEKQKINIPIINLLKYKTISKILENTDYEGKETCITDEARKDDTTADNKHRQEPILAESYTSEPNAVLYPDNIPDIKELNINLQQDISVYLYRALPLYVILSDERLRPWYYEHFINIYAQTDGNGFLALDFVELWCPYKGFLLENCIGYGIMDNVSDIVNFVVARINSGFYAIINVDEYYLPEKSSYLKEHFVHESMIYGYDNTQKKLMALGYNTAGILTRISFDYDSFRKAFQSGRACYMETAPWAENSAVQLIKLRDYIEEYPFEIRRFLKELKHYITSTADSDRAYCLMIPRERLKYGLGVYDAFLDNLKDLLDGRLTVDYRAIHLLYEHKKLLHSRIEYVISRYGLAGRIEELAKDYYKVVNEFRAMRFKYMEIQHYILAEGKTSGIKLKYESGIMPLGREVIIVSSKYKSDIMQIIEGVSSAKEREEKLLTQIYKLLNSCFRQEIIER